MNKEERLIQRQKIEDALNEGYIDGGNDAIKIKNAEVKQIIEEVCKSQLGQPQSNAILKEFEKELLQKLGLDANDSEGVKHGN